MRLAPGRSHCIGEREHAPCPRLEFVEVIRRAFRLRYPLLAEIKSVAGGFRVITGMIGKVKTLLGGTHKEWPREPEAPMPVLRALDVIRHEADEFRIRDTATPVQCSKYTVDVGLVTLSRHKLKVLWHRAGGRPDGPRRGTYREPILRGRTPLAVVGAVTVGTEEQKGLLDRLVSDPELALEGLEVDAIHLAYTIGLEKLMDDRRALPSVNVRRLELNARPSAVGARTACRPLS